MNNLSLIIRTEYFTDVKAKSFWIATFVFPLIMVAFGGFVGFLASDSSSLSAMANPVQPDEEEMSLASLFGMCVGMLLTLFIMVYGAQIFNKVKTEKCNRIVEVMATCVDGRTMMLAKIIAVGLVGLTQLLLWTLLISLLVSGLVLVFNVDIPFDVLINWKLWAGLGWGIAYFCGGYIFFGSLYAAVGAMTDKNNENQEYMSILTFVLLGSFYVGMYAVDHPEGAITQWCNYIPFTSPTVGAVNAVSQSIPLWQSVLSLVVLIGFAALTLVFAGKIYTSSLLLRGKRLTPKDIITFLKSK